MKPELLAPAGNMQKLQTAFAFGADAVYLAGKKFGLRASAGNFTQDEITQAVITSSTTSKKIYVTVNIFAKNADFGQLKEHLELLRQAGVHGIIVADPGVLAFAAKHTPQLEIHISTQANTLNKYAAKFWAEQGAKRVILARELSVADIAGIKDFVGGALELEAFVHGAMCVSYSGRCLISNYVTGKDANRGECTQPCRWQWSVRPDGRQAGFALEQDERGTYLFNSKDLNMIGHLDKLAKAGVAAFKIEGRMKSEYYVGAVVKAYRAVIDNGFKPPKWAVQELEKVSHRTYGTGFYLGGNIGAAAAGQTEDTKSAAYTSTHQFSAGVLGYDEACGELIIRQRNRFKQGDVLECVSADDALHNKPFTISKMRDSQGVDVADAKLVEQILRIKTDIKLRQFDMLRKQL